MVELLVSLGIVIALAAMLLPAFKRTQLRSGQSQCQSTLKKLYVAAESYTADNNGRSLPAQTLNGTSTIFWHWKLRPYLGANSEYDDKMDRKLRCPAIKSTASNYWAWGYGANSRPGWNGNDTPTLEQRFNWEEVNVPAPANWKGTFQAVNITHPSRRLFLCDANEWQVTPSSGAATFPEYHRHGKDACNVLFYDGHVESLNTVSLNKALFDPGS